MTKTPNRYDIARLQRIQARLLEKYQKAAIEAELPARQAKLRSAKKSQRQDGNHWGYFGPSHTQEVPQIAEYEENGHRVTVYHPVVARGAYESEYEGWGI